MHVTGSSAQFFFFPRGRLSVVSEATCFPSSDAVLVKGSNSVGLGQLVDHFTRRDG